MRHALPFVTSLLMFTACGPAEGEMWFLRSRGADMPIWVRGAEHHQTLVLVAHGGPGETSFNMPQSPGFAALEQSTAVAYWDQRGSGTSQGTATDDTLTLAQFTEDLDQTVDLLRARYPNHKLVVLGYSWGGTLSANWLARTPDAAQRIAGWVSLSGATDIPLTVKLSREFVLARIDARLAQGATDQNWKAVRAWYDAHPTMTAEEYLKHTGLVGYLTSSELSHRSGVNFDVIFNSPYSYFALSSNAAHTGPLVLGRIFDENPTPLLAGVTLPTLVISGRLDGQVPVGVGDELYATLGTPEGRKVRLIGEQSGHSMHLDEPALFAETVSAFLEQL